MSCEFIICGLYYVAVCSLYDDFLEFFFNRLWILNAIKSILCNYCDDHLAFILQIVDMVYNTD